MLPTILNVYEACGVSTTSSGASRTISYLESILWSIGAGSRGYDCRIRGCKRARLRQSTSSRQWSHFVKDQHCFKSVTDSGTTYSRLTKWYTTFNKFDTDTNKQKLWRENKAKIIAIRHSTRYTCFTLTSSYQDLFAGFYRVIVTAAPVFREDFLRIKLFQRCDYAGIKMVTSGLGLDSIDSIQFRLTLKSMDWRV